MATTGNKATVQLADSASSVHGLLVKAASSINGGAIVATDATGFAVKGALSTTLKVWGIAERPVDNATGANADKTVVARNGIFKFKNHGADLLAQLDLGNTCYMVDDETAAKTDGGATRSVLGKLVKFDSDGVFVSVGISV